MEVLTRKQARDSGLIKYFTGKPCKYGHVAERYTRSGGCFECEKSRWQNAPKNETNDRAKKSYYKHIKANRSKARDYYQNNDSIRNKRNEDKKRWSKANREHCNAYRSVKRSRVRKATPKWANLNKIRSIYLNCPKGYHVDHVIPLGGKLVCGLNIETNLQYLTKEDNLKKHNRFEPLIVVNKGDSYGRIFDQGLKISNIRSTRIQL